MAYGVPGDYNRRPKIKGCHLIFIIKRFNIDKVDPSWTALEVVALHALHVGAVASTGGPRSRHIRNIRELTTLRLLCFIMIL